MHKIHTIHTHMHWFMCMYCMYLSLAIHIVCIRLYVLVCKNYMQYIHICIDLCVCMCMYLFSDTYIMYVFHCICLYEYVLYCICLYEPVYASRAHAAMISYSGCEPEEDWKLLVEVFPSSFSGSSWSQPLEILECTTYILTLISHFILSIFCTKMHDTYFFGVVQLIY